jgi:uncharacterized protein involved in exopolysaccharide biosynthesis
MSEHEPQSSVDITGLLLGRWKTVVMFTAVGLAAGIAYALLAPEWYRAKLTVVPSSQSSDPAAGLAAKLPAIGGLGAALAADAQRIQAVLTSHSVTDQVIDKFALKDLYEVGYQEKAREALWNHCDTSVDRKSNVVTLSCEDQEPKRARDMAAYFGEVGNQVFGRISATSAREERKFLEKQVEQARADVDQASQALREFQEKHKVVDLTEQSKAVISAMASIKGELLSKQNQLSYLRGFASSGEASVVQLQKQIGIMEEQLKDLELSRHVAPAPPSADGESQGDFFPGAMTFPELRFQLEQLYRDQKIKETVYFLMTQRYETARVDEARDTSTFQILDHPTVPTYRSRPKRSKVALLGLLGGAAAGCAWVILPVWWRQKRRGKAL